MRTLLELVLSTNIFNCSRTKFEAIIINVCDSKFPVDRFLLESFLVHFASDFNFELSEIKCC